MKMQVAGLLQVDDYESMTLANW